VNLYPLEIADVFERHAGVRECVVVGLPNELAGEEAVACVVLREEARATEQELLAHGRRHLDPRRMPARVRVVSSLPRTSTGKPDVAALREALLAARHATVDTEAARRVQATPRAGRRAVIQDLVAREVLAELRALDPAGAGFDTIDTSMVLGDAGLTSLAAVRLAARLGEVFGRPLPATLLFSHPTVDRIGDLVLELFAGTEAAPVANAAPGSVSRDPVAIVGMACRLPGGADTPEAFWHLLRDGRHATGAWPAERGSPPGDALGARSQRLQPRGAFVPRVDLFDARFFNLAGPAAGIDPQHRLILETTWEALERAGQNPLGLHDAGAGVFIGLSGTSYRSPDALGVAPGMAVSRLCHFLDLHGPALTIDTTCSSSLVALHLARESLLRGECSMAIVAGVHVHATLSSFEGLTQLGVLAPDGRTKAFDARADGFGVGEGCVVLVLQRQSDARAAGARIHALVRGSAINHDGRSSSVTAPNPAAQEAVIRAALAAAHTGPAEIQYVEAHGTGTLLGDPIEAQALASVFRDRPTRLTIGSVKTNIGHLEAAAGLAGVLKTVLALAHRELPANVGFETPNPHIPWATVVQARRSRWPDANARLVAGVSGFGMSGTNAHVVLEEAPSAPSHDTLSHGAPSLGPPAPEPATVVHLLPLSARTPEALAESVRRYAAALSTPERTTRALRDVAFTASCGRAHLEYRLAVVGCSEAEWRTKLLTTATEAAPARARPPRRGLAMVFSGQGPQWWGMGRELLADEPVFRDAMLACAERVDRYAGWRLLDEIGRDEAGSRMADTEVAQPALFALQVALCALWRSWGIEPTVVVGHSLGEIAAAHVAGAIALDDAARLVVLRGRVLQRSAGRGKMAAVELDEDEASRLVAEFPGIEVAAVNAPRQVTIGGEPRAVEAAVTSLRARAVACRELQGNVAYHSAHVDAGAREVTASLGSWHPTAPRLRFVSTMAGAEGEVPALDASYWGAQVRRPVRFDRAIGTLLDEGYDAFVEVGPHPVLLPAIAEALEGQGGARATLVSSLRRGAPERAAMLEALGALYTAGLDVEWPRLYPQGGRVVDLPTYPWQRESYWIAQGRPRSARAAAPPEKSAGVQAEVASPVARHVGVADPSDSYLYELAWRETPAVGGTPATGTWVVMLDCGGVGDALCAALEARGARVVCARDSGDGAEFERLLDERFPEAPPAAVVHLGSLDAPRSDATDLAALAAAERSGCISLMHLAQAVARRGWGSALRLFVVTRGAQAATGSVSSVAQAPVWGFGASLAREMPELHLVLLDLDPDSSDLPSLLAELESAVDEERVALRGGRRYVPRLVPRPLPAAGGSGRTMHADRTYVITGGLGGLGLVVAERLVVRGARHLALIGRSAPSDRAAACVHTLEASGARVMVARADVACEDQVAAALSSIEAMLPPVGGVVHAAGVADGGVVAHLSEARVRAMMAAKVRGAWNLHEWSREKALDFFVLFASIAGVLGSPGQAPYAAANTFLDALAHTRRRAGLPAQSVDWGPWGEVGMALRPEDAVHRSRPDLFSPSEGADLFERLLADPSAVQVTAWRRTPRQLRRSGGGDAASPVLRELACAPAAETPAARGAREAIASQAPAQRPRALEDYVRRVVARLAGETADRIDVGDRFEALGLDSLSLISLRRTAQAELGIPVPSAILFEHDTVATLGAWAHQEMFGRPSEGVPAKGSPLIALRAEGAAPPLFLAHAVGGGVRAYRALVESLRRRVYAFEAIGLHDDVQPLGSIETMAARYTEQLVAVQPAGPYLLGGWSLGGCVALEVAQSLRARGGDVRLVALIESLHPLLARSPEGASVLGRAVWGAESDLPLPAPSGNSRDDRAAAVQFFLWDLAMQRGLPGARRAAIHAAMAAAARAAEEGGENPHLLSAIEETGLLGDLSREDLRRLLAVFEANVVAHGRHLPRRYSGRVLLVRAADALTGEPDVGWRDMVDDLHVAVLPGDHYSLLQPPHVEQLAGTLRAHIDAAIRGSDR
jgi:acyl transferase domain-containing protein/thioesterase domain-containing protein